jgi:hypothetical protein
MAQLEFVGKLTPNHNEYYGTAAPTAGTYAVGDICWNTAPAAGEPSFWRCTAAGSPGTWIAGGHTPTAGTNGQILVAQTGADPIWKTISGDVTVDETGAVSIGAGAVASAELAETAVKYAEVSIAAAAVGALRATPATLVAAPGAGKVLEFISAVLILDYTAPGFTETDDNLAVRYTDGSGVIVSQAIECTGFIDQTADTMTTALAKIDAIAAKAGCENKALVLHNTGNGEFGNSGGSALRVKVAYRVHTTAW